MTGKMLSKIKSLSGLKENMDKAWDKLSTSKKADMGKKWDVEHAYYSSTLEGNGLDRKQFEDLAKKIK